MTKLKYLFFFSCGIWLSIVLYQGCTSPNTKQKSSDSPIDSISVSIGNAKYMGDQTCKGCHEEAFQDWHTSHHDLAMQEATPQTILGDFENVSFQGRGIKSRFFKKGEKFFVNTEGKDGNYHDFEVAYTFGVTPLQQYIVRFPDGYFQCLRTAWDTQEKKWFDLYSDTDIAADEWLHWSRGGFNWNGMCADCHSTDLRKNFDPQTKSYHTTWSVINVSCEACHGPGEQHVAWAKSDQKEANSFIKLTKNTPSTTQVGECARCHARRGQITPFYTHEGSLMDHYIPEILREPLYYADGQIRDEVYVYGSFIQSKMYHNQVKCTDCHNPHSLKLKFTGNKLCLQCHDSKAFDTSDHHFHPVNSEGASCINCHMPGKFYMVNDFRRDHSFRIPRPDLSVKYNTPNACITCHKEKSDQWAADAVDKWYGRERASHFSEALLQWVAEGEAALPLLIQLVHNQEEPAIARATAVYYLRQSTQPVALEVIRNMLADKEPLVRYHAAFALQTSPPNERKQYLAPLLKDSVRAVRIQAAQLLADIPDTEWNSKTQKYLDNALDELYISFEVNADFSAGQLLQGEFYQKTNQAEKAEKAYLQALEIDNLENMARMNLATLYNRQGKNEEARNLLEYILKREPSFGEGYYSLGLILAEEKKWEEAAQKMEKASRLIPNNPRIFYNWGLILQHLKKPQEAEKVYLQGLVYTPNYLALHHVLAILYLQQKQYDKAEKHVVFLVQQDPENREYQQLLRTWHANK